MSNAAGTKSSREEEIAFLAMEEVLGVDIKLADAGAGDKKPDGTWVCSEGLGRHGIVEVTSPPAKSLMREWAAAKREGRARTEGGSVPTRFGELAQVCNDMLAEDWAKENFEKLLSQHAHERHLFLFSRGYDVAYYFYRLSDSYDGACEHVADLVVPDGISDVWFRGRARRDASELLGPTDVWLARFQAGSGWHRYLVNVEEERLPPPNAGIADDPVPDNWRRPKERTNIPTGD